MLGMFYVFNVQNSEFLVSWCNFRIKAEMDSRLETNFMKNYLRHLHDSKFYFSSLESHKNFVN